MKPETQAWIGVMKIAAVVIAILACVHFCGCSTPDIKHIDGITRVGFNLTTTTAQIPEPEANSIADHFKQHWKKYLTTALAVGGSYYLYEEYNDDGSSGKKHQRTGEMFVIDGNGNRISIHDESLSPDFTVEITGENNTFSTQPD